MTGVGHNTRPLVPVPSIWTRLPIGSRYWPERLRSRGTPYDHTGCVSAISVGEHAPLQCAGLPLEFSQLVEREQNVRELPVGRRAI